MVVKLHKLFWHNIGFFTLKLALVCILSNMNFIEHVAYFYNLCYYYYFLWEWLCWDILLN